MAVEIDLSKMFNIPVPTQLKSDELIIVVDDQQDLRLIVVHQLQKSFTNVKQAANGYEALQLLTEHKKAGAIFCDIEMPVMGGVDFMNEIRERVELDRGPFCLMMDNVSKERIMLAVETGVDEILVKPFTLNDIVPKIRQAFKVFHNPKNPEKVYELAKSFLRAGKFDDAEKVYKALSEAVPKAARPIVGLARIAVGRQDLGAALKLLDDAESRNKNFVHTHVVRGEIYSKQSDWNKAIECYKAAINMSPLNGERYRAAAEALFKVNRYADAAQLLEMATKNQLDFKDLYHYLSQAQFALKDFQKAARYIRSALITEPENVTYLNQLGICLKESQQYDEAQKIYNQIIKLDPENQAALYNKAVLNNTKGDTAEAIRLLEKLLKKYPDFGPAKNKIEEYKKNLAAASNKGAA